MSAITDVWGKVNNIPVIFNLVDLESGKWATNFPTDLEGGTYVLEVWAKDAAGNIGHIANIIFTFDPTQMCVKIVGIYYCKSVFLNEYEVKTKRNHYVAHVSKCYVCDRF